MYWGTVKRYWWHVHARSQRCVSHPVYPCTGWCGLNVTTHLHLYWRMCPRPWIRLEVTWNFSVHFSSTVFDGWMLIEKVPLVALPSLLSRNTKGIEDCRSSGCLKLQESTRRSTGKMWLRTRSKNLSYRFYVQTLRSRVCIQCFFLITANIVLAYVYVVDDRPTRPISQDSSSRTPEPSISMNDFVWL